jgi:hypothetical protein
MVDFQDIGALLGAPLLAALVQVVKPFIPDERLYPVISLLLGVGLYTLAGVYLGKDPLFAALNGLAAGLAASGLYSGGKTVLGR